MRLRKHEQVYTSSLFRTQYFDLLAVFESFLGMHREALEDDDLVNGERNPFDEIIDERYKLRNAKNMIIDASKSHPVIFINEAHHSPQHRAFTLELLQSLYDNGFRYFAAEALDMTDIGLNVRGYPLSQKTGLLTNEPMYGELIRAAQKIGFTVVAYESMPDCNPWKESPEKCQNLRGEGQAKNLYDSVFKRDPSAKLLVHAGFGHIAKKGVGGWIPMAVYFEQLTGISPFSIDQTIMREHSARNYENSIFKQITGSGRLKNTSVIVSNDEHLWLGGNEGIYDLILFHPRTIYQNKRPSWLFHSEHRIKWPVATTRCKGKFPCVIEALLYREDLNSVPIDRVVVSSMEERPVLALLPGKYFFRTIDKRRNLLSLTKESVDLEYSNPIRKLVWER